MASPQDPSLLASSSIGSQPFQHYQPPEGPPPFPPPIQPPHPDQTLQPAHLPHVSPPLPQMFQSDLDPQAPLPISMQVPVAALGPSPVDIAQMEALAAPLQRQPAQPLVADFSVPNTSFPSEHAISTLKGLDPSQQFLPSPPAPTAPNTSQHASPPLGSMPTSYMIGSSSLASALDGTATSRSRSGSSASPGLLNSASPDLSYSSCGSGPPTSDPSLTFTPGFERTIPSSKENSPDVPGDSHLLFLGSMLKRIAQTANTGSEACSMGQSTDARDIVDVLKKNVLLVADLVAAMQLGDTSGAPSAVSSPNPRSGPPASSSSVISGSLEVGQQQLLNPPSTFSAPPSTVPSEPNLAVDPSDMSRKRCASSVAGDRVLKAPKLEPQDDLLLQNLQPVVGIQPLQASVLTAPAVSSFTFPSPAAIPPSIASVVEQASLPPSVPASRPQTPSRIAHSSLNMLQDYQHSAPPMHTPLHFPQHIDPLQTIPQSAPVPVSSAPATVPTSVTAGFATAGITSPTWADSRTVISRHQHSLSGNSVLSGVPHSAIPVTTAPTALQYSPAPPSVSTFTSPTRTTHTSQPPVSVPVPITVPGSAASTLVSIRSSRSSSISHPNPFAYSHPDVIQSTFEVLQSRPSTSGLYSTRPSSPDYDNDADGENDSDDAGYGSPQGHYHSPNDYSQEDVKPASDPSMEDIQPSSRRMSRTTPPSEGGGSTNHVNEVPAEYRAEVERIFFEFLTKTCSNLDATDGKGEPIHQTLMAKKMQRLDESPDFRPFKFRIQAFTNAFLEELSRQGYPEEKIPMKKIRNFLWNQPFISRFNEEGKKSKSKGNHIWHVDAKKTEGGLWSFRPFQRRLAGAPPGVAYVGLRWAWTPRIWDPQASRTNMPVTYSSQLLPSWLSWKDEVLSGVPPPDAQSCDVTVEARFIQDGKEELLTHTVHISIAPMAAVDASFAPSRRPSLVGDIHNPRRVMSDTVLPQTTPPRPIRGQNLISSVPPVVAPDSQVVQVLTTAAQRVAQEAQSQVVASPMDAGPELQALAKQQHVLTVTAQAFNNKGSSELSEGAATQSNALAAAAQLVVLSAARQVAADRTVAAVSSGVQPEAPQVTVKEVSVATQSAVAQAVEMVGPLSSEVDVLMTAKSLLQQQTRGSMASSPATVDPSQMAAPLDPVRPHSTGNMLHSFALPSSLTMPQTNGFYTHGS